MQSSRKTDRQSKHVEFKRAFCEKCSICFFFQTVIIDSDPSNQMAVGAMSQVHSCQWCYKQYVLKDKLLKHQRANHYHLLPSFLQVPKPSKKLGHKSTKPIDQSATASKSEQLTQTVNLQFTGMCSFENRVPCDFCWCR